MLGLGFDWLSVIMNQFWPVLLARIFTTEINLIYWTTKETWHLVFVNILVLNEITVNFYFLCLTLNYGNLRCIENF